MVTRRQLVVTFVASTVTTAVAANSAFADPTALPTPLMTPTTPVVSSVGGEISSFDVISGDYAARSTMPFVLSQQVRIQNQTPLHVVVEFDGRLFAAGDSVIVSCGDRYEVAATTVEMKDAPVTSTASYDVPAMLDGATDALVMLSLPLAVRERYPADGLDMPLPLIVSILGEDGAKLARSEWNCTEQVPAAAWGAEVSATWTQTGVIDGARTGADQYRYPAALQCSSVGPGTIPIGSTLTIELDSKVIESCAVGQITPVELVASTTAAAAAEAGSTVVTQPGLTPWATNAFAVASEIKDEILRTTVTFAQEVPAGTAIAIQLSVTEKSGDPTLTSVAYASALLAGPAGGGYWQRDTGKYTVTDLTGSGMPQVPDVAQGKI